MSRETRLSTARPLLLPRTFSLNNDNFYRAHQDSGPILNALLCCLRVSVFLLLVMAQIGVARAEDGGSLKCIRGVITTREGHPVVAATVEMFHFDGNRIATSATDSEGRFEIDTAADQGEYELIVNRATEGTRVNESSSSSVATESRKMPA